MARDEQEVDVDRERTLTVDVMASGMVKIRLSGKFYKECGPGDSLVLILRPPKIDEERAEIVEELLPELKPEPGRFRWPILSSGYDGSLVEYIRKPKNDDGNEEIG
jgi:hypothetical protein